MIHFPWQEFILKQIGNEILSWTLNNVLFSSYLDTAKSIASDFLDALADSRFDVHIVAQTLFLDSDIDPPRSRFNRDWLQMKKEIDLISMSTDRSCNLDAIIKVIFSSVINSQTQIKSGLATSGWER